jgi:hypothetical protein
MIVKSLKYIAVAALTFCTGVGLTALWVTYSHQKPPQLWTLQIQPTSVTPTAAVIRTYESQSHASGFVGKYRAYFANFSSSDGMKFSSTNMQFDSPQQAQRELQKRLKPALEIRSREKLFDETGKEIGEQVVATFSPYDGESTPSANLLLTRGSVFVSVSSSSLHNISEYKKSLNP